MSILQGKKILVGITGSIAAYKSAVLVREFVKRGAEVKVVMTPSAIDFITPLTLATLAGNPVYSDFTEDKDRGTWTNHVELGLWADYFIVAPASANTLAKMSQGISDNFLLATYLSARCPVYAAPAMDLDMFSHRSTQDNLSILKDRQVKIIEPGSGELASGLVGKGRMQEPEEIAEFLEEDILSSMPLSGKKAIVSAGPTHEAIDPVRFIGNRSSGKMGYALAESLANHGAEVTLISGPSHLNTSHRNIKTIRVTSASEMMDACKKHFKEADITIMAAAVADYRPLYPEDQKIKKKDSVLEIELEKTEDILFHLGKVKKDDQLLIGFALETENELENAQSKLEKKNLDMIVLNSLRDKGAGFEGDTNKVSFIESGNKISKFELKSKAAVAIDIVEKIISLIKA